MFSMRPSASTECSAARACVRPALSTIASTTCANSPETCRPLSMTPQKSPRAWRTLGDSRPVSQMAIWQAEKNEMPSCAARPAIFWIEVVPMPRRGVLITRWTATSSSGLQTALR